MHVTVYIDESGTHDNSPLIMGGVIGRLGQWATHDEQWQRMLRQSRLPYFHSESLRSSKDPFKGWTIAQKHDLVKRISKIQAKHTECRFASVLHKSEYDAHYKSGEKPKRIPLDTMYGVSFRMCLSFAVDMVQDVIKWADPKIDFVLEAGHKNAGDADRIFRQIKKQVPELREVLGDIRFGEKDSAAGLQGADAVAYSALQSEREGAAELADFTSESNLEYARRTASSRSPVFRLGGKPEILAAMRENLVTLEEYRREYAAKRTGSAGS